MVRKMESTDLAAVAGLERECFSMPWSEQALAQSLNSRDVLFCVCEVEGQIVGYVGMYLVYPEGDIANVAVKKTCRRHGYAQEMLHYLFAEAQKQGITEYTLEVRESNEAAIRLYEKMGFKIEGKRKNFYELPKEHALILWKRS